MPLEEAMEAFHWFVFVLNGNDQGLQKLFEKSWTVFHMRLVNGIVWSNRCSRSGHTLQRLLTPSSKLSLVRDEWDRLNTTGTGLRNEMCNISGTVVSIAFVAWMEALHQHLPKHPWLLNDSSRVDDVFLGDGVHWTCESIIPFRIHARRFFARAAAPNLYHVIKW